MLSPIQRVIRKQLEDGATVVEVATSLRKRPGTIRRFAEMADYAIDTGMERDRSRSTSEDGLRPIERRVMAMRTDGERLGDIAAKFRRSPQHIRRIEEYAQMKQTRS
ncbi:MAG: hypothetical protein KJO36_02195 [Acidimicrobiia bacterium]|nr:hypothetical protein [Acidimicrobiia bacterium]NNC42206.1 hypothetical protein [Acidimicrobiia bacterium]